MTLRDSKISELNDCVHVVADIECSQCKEGSTLEFADQFEAGEEFYNDGWRIFEDEVWCPKCVKKRRYILLKKKK